MQETSPEAGEGTAYLWFHFLVIASVINSCSEQQLVLRVQSGD